MKDLLQKVPFQLFCVIIFAFVFGNYIPETILSFFLTVSLSVKAILVFLLPFIIFSLLFHSFSKINGSAFLFSFLLIALVCASNFMAVCFSYIVGCSSKIFISSFEIKKNAFELMPLFNIPNIKIHEHGNFIAIVLGASLGLYSSITTKFQKVSDSLSKGTLFFLRKIFLKILPLFVLGFVFKMQKDGILLDLFKKCSPLFITIFLAQWCYIIFFYFVFSSFDFKIAKQRIFNILPACIVGFSTMSSAAAMPILVDAALKNTNNKTLIGSVVPSVINSHMLGDAIGIPIMALSILSALPSFSDFFYFALAFMINKFAAAGIPGGTIIVMIPILEKYLNFDSEMSALILMLYVFFDCICTTASILGNGLYAIAFEKIWDKVRK